MELVHFIAKQTEGNVGKLLDCSGHMLEDSLEHHPYDYALDMLLKLDAQAGFKYFMNELHHLHCDRSSNLRYIFFKVTEHPPSTDSYVKFVETLVSSEGLRYTYYKQVTTLTRQKGSFSHFYSNHLEGYTRKKGAKQIGEVFSRVLTQSPYNVAFGIYLIEKRKKLEDVLSLNIDSLIQKCASDMKEFDFCRLGRFTEID